MTELIAELCQNHNGSREILEEMVEAAAKSGADFAKIQTIFADDLTPRGRFETGEVENNKVTKTIKRPYKPEYQRLKDLELTEDDHRFFIETCDKYGITPLTTVFSRKRIPMVASLPWPESVVKVGSFDCASKPMLRELANEFDRLLISTGGTYDEEIEETAEMLSEMGADYTFLHCVTSYPTELQMSHLSRMEWLHQFTSTVGWSDHTLVERDGILAAKAAIALGADIIERHFTILEPDKSKDGPVSITPELLSDLREFVDQPREEQLETIKSDLIERGVDLETLKGQRHRELTHQEVLNRDYYRGRFASYNPETKSWVYNWESAEITHE